jgi:hypothetical protein
VEPFSEALALASQVRGKDRGPLPKSFVKQCPEKVLITAMPWGARQISIALMFAHFATALIPLQSHVSQTKIWRS